jgi:hypothetical protein
MKIIASISSSFSVLRKNTESFGTKSLAFQQMDLSQVKPVLLCSSPVVIRPHKSKAEQ